MAALAKLCAGTRRRFTAFTRLGVLTVACISSSSLAQNLPPYAWRVTSIDDISPDQSSLHDTDPDGASGGRVNSLALARGDEIAYAASEWGGIYKSRDGGYKWTHLDGHLPSATWRVKVDPRSSERVYATSFFDGRVNSLSGINISEDGGRTWVHPATATPPPNFCKNATSRTEFSAFGISISPDNPDVVYVGTACGIAVTINHGISWTFVDPSPDDPADAVWDVLAQQGGVIDACGDDGHARSPNSGQTWKLTHSLPSGRCSLAASPDEPNVLFSVVGTQPYESDDAGSHWTTLENPFPQGRIPFVKTNKRSVTTYDLWFGDVTLYRIPCTTPQNADTSPRCSAQSDGNWHGPFTRKSGGHDDVGDLAFSTLGSQDHCPRLFASDGGVHINSILDSPVCHNPKWLQPDITPHGLWMLTLDGVSQPSWNDEDLYIGNQDDGTFVTRNALASRPDWTNVACCDSPLIAATSARIVYASCCYVKPDRFNKLFIGDAWLANSQEINNYPPGDVPGWEPRILAPFGPKQYAVTTTSGVFTTLDITANPIRWTALAPSSTPAKACGLFVSSPKNGSPTFFVQTDDCDGRAGSSIFRLDGTGTKAIWRAINKPQAEGTFGVFAVDAHHPLSMIGSFLMESEPYVEMLESPDGGKTWNRMPALDAAMTQNGAFEYKTEIGPTDSTGFDGYPQPTLVAIDAEDSHLVAAAGADSGLFLSVDGGNTWQQILLNGRTLYRARGLRFAHSSANDVEVFAGSEGAGAWRIRLTR